MVGLNPLGIIIPAALALIALLMLPALVLPWKMTCGYFGALAASLVASWYGSDLPSSTIAALVIAAAVASQLAILVRALRTGARLHPSPLLVAITILSGPLAVVVTAEAGKSLWYHYSLPAEYSHAAPVYLPRQLGISCEMTVWRIGAPHSPAPMRGWITTPYVVSQAPDRWLHGLSCSQANADSKAAIIDAMNAPGSYYKVDGDHGHIVIPEQSYLVTVFNHRAAP